MSILVQNLTKIYGHQHAIDHVSFEVDRGEIVGFLGPNGAGKSTTMKIATGYIQATKGVVKLNDLDVTRYPVKSRYLVGYLPENNPLYLDMYVHEFLRFTGGFYHLKRKARKARIQEVLEMSGLEKEQNKLIGQLSKGYRQRVGLAQALLHDPPILILDEPTSGLDPNQLVEIRNLIKIVGENKTVLFSTHIMQEVEAICDRAIVINEGSIVADDKISKLKHNVPSHLIVVEFSEGVEPRKLNGLEGVKTIRQVTSKIYEFHISTESDIRSYLMKEITNRQLPIVGMNQKTISMEEVFANLTKADQHD